MRLTPGTRLGPYEVVEPVGAGGMGEVYRARDLRLNRDVALKVIAFGVPDDGARSARFEREARAAAALNHPNICTIHDVGDVDGQQFLVMELLDGESLDRRLLRGPLPVDRFFDAAVGLADGLEAAHARGLIHRDLKPANILLTRRGEFKILDFGLVKHTEPAQTATFHGSDRLTDEAVTVGTLAYMSPEQMRGEPLDRRTDIFSLALVLFEMATGRHPFGRATGPLVSAAILSDAPAVASRLRAELPARLDDILLKGLEKDRELRYQSMAELRADLMRLRRDLSGRGRSSQTGSEGSADRVSDGPEARQPQEASAPSDTKLIVGIARRHPALLACAGIVLLSAVAATAWISWRSLRASQVGADDFPHLQIQPLTLSGDAQQGAVSPDGRFVAYVRAHGGIALRQIASEHDVPLVRSIENRSFDGLSFTTDGNFVDYVVGDGDRRELWRVPLLGGTSRRLLNDIASVPGRSPDGRRIAFLRRLTDATPGTSLVVADEDGSHEQALVTRHLPLDFVNLSFGPWAANRPAWSPDSKTIVVAGMSVGGTGYPTAELVFVDASRGHVQRTVPVQGLAWEASWLDDNRLLVGASIGSLLESLWSVNLRENSWKLVVREFSGFSGLSLAADGRMMLATRATRQSGLWLGDPSASEGRTVLPPTAEAPQNPAVDNNGGAVYSAFAPTGQLRTYRLPPGATAPILLDDQFYGFYGFATSPDGGFVILTGGAGAPRLRRVRGDGTGSEPLLDRPVAGPAVTPDGKYVFFSPIGMPGLFRMALAGGSPQKVSDRFVATGLAVSPDGRQLAFLTEKQNVFVICDLADCTNPRDFALKSASTACGVSVCWQWGPDGKGIAYVNKQDRGNIWEEPLDGTAPYALTHLQDPQILEFAWSPNGRHLLLSRGTTSTDLVLLKGLK